MPFCTCRVRCKGGKQISQKSYREHKRFRDPYSKFSAEFSAFMVAASHKRGQRPIAPDSGLRGGGISSGQVDGEDLHDVESNNQVDDEEPLDVEPNALPFDEAPSFVQDDIDNSPQIPMQEDSPSPAPPGVTSTVRTQQEHREQSPSYFDGEADPGSLATSNEIDIGEHQGTDNHPLTSDLSTLDDLFNSATLDNIRLALEFIRLLKTASLSDDHLTPDVVARLKEPPSGSVNLTPDELLSLEIFISMQNTAQHVYTSVKAAVERRYPESELLTYDKVKQLIADITGVFPITDHMCIKSCVAYTGPFRDLAACPVCSEPRYDSAGCPRQLFNTIPVGPLLQALKRDKDKATALRYRALRTEALLAELEANGNMPTSYSDFFDGSQYLDAVNEGLIKEDDIVLMLSLDGAQIFMSKHSDCWVCIWVVFDHAPDVRYKKPSVLPAFVIPGPNAPRIMDAFLYRSLQHLIALQRDGLRIWDASKNAVVTSHPFFALAAADGPGLTHLNGLVGHMGKNGCRLYCGIRGRRKPRDSHYYPALLKPLAPYSVEGCDHPDLNFDDLHLFVPSAEKYREHLHLLVRSEDGKRYKANRLETGIVKPSIFLGLEEKNCFPVPLCFGSDIMHHCSLNIPDLLIPLWRGTFDCSATDKRSNWNWVVLTGETWTEHGKTVATATPYLPGSFDRPPRNPALKISSGYKAWEFLMYMYGLGPGVFYNILPSPYYENFCDLVYGMRIINQHHISAVQLLQAEESLFRFARDFEELYYQRRVDRIHFVRQSIHQCLHLAFEVTRVGPPITSSQWTMERTIGNLTQELRQPSNPYANLAQRALLRCQINALKNIIPQLEEPVRLPRNSIDLGDGYILLRRRDTTARAVLPDEERALVSYLQTLSVFTEISSQSQVSVVRWARLRLPTGQIARCLWTEKSKPLDRLRMARNVKIMQPGSTNTGIEIAEVRFYFRLTVKVENQMQELTLACVSCYSHPHEGLLQASQGTLWSCTHLGAVKVVDVKSITAVIAMVPHEPFPGEKCFFLVEKPGLDVATIGGKDEEMMDID